MQSALTTKSTQNLTLDKPSQHTEGEWVVVGCGREIKNQVPKWKNKLYNFFTFCSKTCFCYALFFQVLYKTFQQL